MNTKVTHLTMKLDYKHIMQHQCHTFKGWANDIPKHCTSHHNVTTLPLVEAFPKESFDNRGVVTNTKSIGPCKSKLAQSCTFPNSHALVVQ